MAYTADDLTAIQTAITKLMTGDRVVKISKGDEMIEYGESSLPQLRAIRAEILSDINASAGRPRHFRISTSKGV